MDKDFVIYKSAELLPQSWDNIADKNIFLKKDFLIFLENVNPCKQEYHLCERRNIIMVCYKLGVDILSFKNGGLKVPLRIVGIPVSLSSPGFVCPNESLGFFEKYLNSFPFLLILNTYKELSLPSASTLATYEMEISDENFEDYLNKLKSNQRRRIKKAISKGKKLEFKPILSNEFSDAHLKLYNEVFERSEGRLEKLSIEYFQKMPAEIVEINCEKNLLGFLQMKQIEGELVFLFCGISKEKNLKYDTYLNLLIYILKTAIERKLSKVHLGQTTDYSKTRVGGEKKPRYMHIAGYMIPKKSAQILMNFFGNKE